MDDDPAPRTRGLRVTVVGTTPSFRAAAAGLGRWLAAAPPARARGQATVALVSDAAMRRLNASFRGVDRTTDVLSFPAGDGGPWLGDIAIGGGLARRQAREQGHPLRTELRILALHGLLHLLGYDHETDQGRMRRAEERLRRRAGLPVGLTARGGGRPARRR
jgi:probable rRNA maturation factor